MRTGPVLALCCLASSCGVSRDRPFQAVPTTVSVRAEEFLRRAVPQKLSAGSAADFEAARLKWAQSLATATDRNRARFVKGTEVEEIAGVRVTITTPVDYNKARDDRLILYIHGGGYTMGSPDHMMAVYAPVGAAVGLKTYSIDYRLAPEHPFPKGLEDCVAVYRDLLGSFRAENIAVLGDGAGGALALALVLEARRAGLALPAAIGLYSPWADITKTGDTYRTLQGVAPVLHYERNLRSSAEAYAGHSDMADPRISPVNANFRGGFPPTRIHTGTRDLFLSNSVRLHRRLVAHDVTTELGVWEGMWHLFEARVTMSESREAILEMAAFLKQYVRRDAKPAGS